MRSSHVIAVGIFLVVGFVVLVLLSPALKLTYILSTKTASKRLK